MQMHKGSARRATVTTATAALALCVGLGALPVQSAMAEFAPSFRPAGCAGEGRGGEYFRDRGPG